MRLTTIQVSPFTVTRPELMHRRASWPLAIEASSALLEEETNPLLVFASLHPNDAECRVVDLPFAPDCGPPETWHQPDETEAPLSIAQDGPELLPSLDYS